MNDLQPLLFKSLLTIYLPILLIVAAGTLGILLVGLFLKKCRFRRSRYQDLSGNSFYRTFTDLGTKGEYQTYLVLLTLPSPKQILLNAYLPKNDEQTTEVDMILITTTAIFVCECKNYSGCVYGKEDDWHWTHLVGGKKYSFYNPIKQNETHIRALKRVLYRWEGLPIFSLIIFQDHCRLKGKMGYSAPVIHQKKARSIIRQLQNGLPEILDKKQIDLIARELEPYTHQSKHSKEKHIKNIKKF